MNKRIVFGAAILAVAVLYLSLAVFSEKITYGSDRDAFLVAHVAELLAHHQPYEPSRLPGFPVFERCMSFFVSQTDARPAKVMVAACSIAVVALVFYLGLLAGGETLTVLLVGIFFAVVPLWMMTSFVAMDYTVSILFVIAAAKVFSFCSKPSIRLPGALEASAVVGILIALGVSTRLTAFLFLPSAIGAIIFDKQGRPWAIRISIIAGLIISSSLFSVLFLYPVIHLYGIKFLSGTRGYHTLLQAFIWEIQQLFSLGGGLIGSAGIVVLTCIAISNLRGRIIEHIWTRQGWAIRTVFLFSIFNTICYYLNPDKASYYLPLLIGTALFLIIGLRRKNWPLLLAGIAIMAGSLFWQVNLRHHHFQVEPGLVKDEWQRQKKDKALYDAMIPIVNNQDSTRLLFGFPSTDRMLVWFFDKASIYKVIPHPNCKTMWGTWSYYPEPVYNIGNLLATDPPQLFSQDNTNQLRALLETRNIKEIILVRSPAEIRLNAFSNLPGFFSEGRVCRELRYF